jgi:predicted transcriptional regulator
MSKIIYKYNLNYKPGQQYVIDGLLLVYIKMVKGRLLFKDATGAKHYYSPNTIQ